MSRDAWGGCAVTLALVAVVLFVAAVSGCTGPGDRGGGGLRVVGVVGA